MTRGVRAALLVLFTLVVGVCAIAYPLFDRQWEWLGVTWQYPKFLFLLLVVPVVFWRGTYGEDDRTPRLRMGTVAPLAAGPRGIRARLRDLPGVVRAFAIALLALAMARPVSASRPDTESESGIDIVVVLDLSGSMRAVFDAPAGAPRLGPIGKRATRLDTAKEVIRDFIGRRKTDRIGVVVFGKSAYVLSPPTLDYHLLDLLVDKMTPGGHRRIGDRHRRRGWRGSRAASAQRRALESDRAAHRRRFQRRFDRSRVCGAPRHRGRRQDLHDSDRQW